MLLIFLPPALLLFTVFVALPMLNAALFSPFSWTGYGPNPWTQNPATDVPYGSWVGAKNFLQLANHGAFATAGGNTLKVIAVSLFIQLPVALVLALLIYDKAIHNTLFRLIFFVPYILADVATGLIWSFVFDGNVGLPHTISSFLGMEQSFFPLADRQWALTTILAVIVWKYFGFHMMIFIAGFQSIPSEITEAAKIDGASRLQTSLLIMIPMIWPSITVSIFYSVLGALQVFDLVMPMTAGGPSNSSHTLVSYLYNFGFLRMQVGLGSAVGVVLFIVATLFAFTYRNTIQRRIGN